jgi:glycine oxidase
VGVRLREWSGVRPRPEGRPAPVIGRSGRVIMATGHYRNGVLLAPVTAREVIELMGLALPIELRWMS